MDVPLQLLSLTWGSTLTFLFPIQNALKLKVRPFHSHHLPSKTTEPAEGATVLTIIKGQSISIKD